MNIIIFQPFFSQFFFIYFTRKIFGDFMAKTQTFSDKAKGKKKDTSVNVKLIKTVKTPKGSYKFSEKFVKIEDISKITDIK
jgi:hypothetical protein